MDPIKIIEKYYDKNSKSYKLLIEHSMQVAKKAQEIAKLNPDKKVDLNFLYEAAMLHDIGIFKINAPKIGCFGNEPYIKHGILGAKILEKEGYFKHAKICKTHTRIIKENIIREHLPLPKEDFMPETTEEEIVALADAFYSKSPRLIDKELSIDKVQKKALKHGKKKLDYMNYLLNKYNLIQKQNITI